MRKNANTLAKALRRIADLLDACDDSADDVRQIVNAIEDAGFDRQGAIDALGNNNVRTPTGAWIRNPGEAPVYLTHEQREAKLEQLGVAPAARWTWTNEDIQSELRKSPEKRAADKRANERENWEQLFRTTMRTHGCDLKTACLSWLDAEDMAQLAKVGVGGFGEALR